MPNPNQLPCGCRKDTGFVCFAHRPQWWGNMIASDPLALVALSLFISVIAVVCAIFD